MHEPVGDSGRGVHSAALQQIVSDMLECGVDPGRLSGTDVQLLREIARGRSNQEIARLTGRTPQEVVAAVHSLLDTLAIAGRAQAILYAIVHRLVAAEEVPALSVTLHH